MFLAGCVTGHRELIFLMFCSVDSDKLFWQVSVDIMGNLSVEDWSFIFKAALSLIHI